jgi:hypothetical protein
MSSEFKPILNFHNDRKVHEIINRNLTILNSKD